ncbi:type II secretion system F family protein [Pseudokineococcus basanitobsidens]|uniref:Type II secretion system F family protein n=1 Tax=Pseudokineococcus basanitobsidens TaxID=1926649 RepID=A0ABU8RK17_9ACTN
MTGLVVAVLVLGGAGVLVGPSAGGRLVRVLARASPQDGARRQPPSWWHEHVRRDARSPAPDTAAQVAQLAVLLRAGLAPAAAWQHLTDVAGPGPGGAWRGAAVAAAEGASVAAALRACLPAARAEGGGAAAALAAATASMDLCEHTGAPAARVLTGVASALRDEADARDAREAALAAPRATARVLLGLPVAGVLLGQAVGAEPLVVLTTTAVGRLAAVVGVALGLVGWWWSRALVRGAETGPRGQRGRPARGVRAGRQR